ncbi:MAG: hypothetical protein BMS9Abin30_0409 [Gammaproteobacteria bacterium]|nr:MAG: hypothetical protein BMS9Abin30_0409 [Gammaproteobacteria bacterium]
MSIVNRKFRRHMLTLAIAAALPFSAVADEKYDLLQQQVDALQQQLQQVQDALQQYKEEMTVKEGQVEQEVTALKEDVVKADEWRHPDTLIHMSGYADVGYAFASGETGSFSVGRFSPIFHYQYRDLVMLESEIEIEIDEAGETELTLEYLTIDYFLNDYMALVGGRFLSPIGQFRQNIHPSWINKLASAPPGFGHDGAAPTSDVGLQLRGGFPIGNTFANYAVYVSNGPELISTLEDDEFELEGINAEGLGSDADGEKVFGGRFGFRPLSGMEIGISAATGKATVTALELAHGGDEDGEEQEKFRYVLMNEGGDEEGDEPGFDLHDEQARDYDVFGADFVWSIGLFKLRGEYVKSKVGAADVGVTASPGATWISWYTQASYLIPGTRLEPVIRYTDFNPPEESRDQKQWGLGLNYLISSNVVAKVTYEYNDGQVGSMADTDRWLFQLAYGF